MAKMTPEERKAREQAKDREWREQVRRFPDAGLGKRAVRLYLHVGEKGVLHVRIPEDAEEPWKADCEPWGYPIRLNNIAELGEFIRALACRYNAMVVEANRAAQAGRLATLDLIECGIDSFPTDVTQ